MTRSESSIVDLTQAYVEPEVSKLCNKATYSTLFLLPSLGISLSDRYLARYFLNAFIDDLAIKHDFQNPLFLLFQTSKFDENWKMYEKFLRNKENFVYEYNCGMKDEKFLVMFVFEFPSLFKEDYVHFLNGKYSSFSDFYCKFIQKIIPLGGDQVENPAWGAIRKTDTLKAKIEDIIGQSISKYREYWPQYKPEREIYRYILNS